MRVMMSNVYRSAGLFVVVILKFRLPFWNPLLKVSYQLWLIIYMRVARLSYRSRIGRLFLRRCRNVRCALRVFLNCGFAINVLRVGVTPDELLRKFTQEHLHYEVFR